MESVIASKTIYKLLITDTYISVNLQNIKEAFKIIGVRTWASRTIDRVFDLRRSSSSKRFLCTESRISDIFIARENSAFCKDRRKETKSDKKSIRWLNCIVPDFKPCQNQVKVNVNMQTKVLNSESTMTHLNLSLVLIQKSHLNLTGV